MRKLSVVFLMCTLLVLLWACGSGENTENTVDADPETYSEADDSLRYEGEKHLKNVRQLTFGGENAEAYFSADGKNLVWQYTHIEKGVECDQIYYSPIPESGPLEYNLLSTGLGRTTCSYFLKGDNQIVYASTHLDNENCPPPVDRSAIDKYVWPIYGSFEIFTADLEGNITNQLTDNEFYDAEATVSPNGDLIVFTSTRDGDLDLYTMKPDGSDVNRVTHDLGYDGGAFFTPDGESLIFRASRPQTEEAITEYTDLLARDLVAPTNMELYICKTDGSELRKITDLGHANWAPFMHPDGKRILFSSNSHTGMFPFNLFMINTDGTGLEQVTFNEAFDSFPMFSRDGSKLVWSSNRHNGGTRHTNIFIADWVD